MEPYLLLERAVAEWAGYTPEQVVTCNSGTAALHLALEAFRLPKGMEVIIPDYTMISCARACTLAGLGVTLIDCGPNLLMSPDLLTDYWHQDASRVAGHTSAIMAVHVYGRRSNMDQIWQFALDNGLKVIEDMAEIHGVKPDKVTDAACWSFYRNKLVAGEEGGAVAFRNVEHANYARMLRSVGFTPAHDYRHVPRGHNYRLANLLATPILGSLSNIHLNSSRRRQNEEKWDKALQPLYDSGRLQKMPPRQSPWVYDVRVPGMTSSEQARLVIELNCRDIPARHGFVPISSQEEYSGCQVVGKGMANSLAPQILYLPLGPTQLESWATSKAVEVFKA